MPRILKFGTIKEQDGVLTFGGFEIELQGVPEPPNIVLFELLVEKFQTELTLARAQRPQLDGGD